MTTLLNILRSTAVVLFGFGIVLFAPKAESPKNLKTIPKETNVISVIDFNSVANKGKLEDYSNLNFFKAFKLELKKDNEKIVRLIDDVMDNPISSGLNTATDMFAYYINEAKDEKYVCISAEIKSEQKFTEFIEETLDKKEDDFDVEKTYNYTLVDNRMAIGWDTDKVVFLTADNIESCENLDVEIETLFELEEQDQITSKKEFNEFYNNKKDAKLYFSSNVTEVDEIKDIYSEEMVNVPKHYTLAYMNIGNR